MKQIRLNVFETNSSSTHSLIMAEDHIFQKWIDGEFLYNDGYDSVLKGKDFVTKEEALGAAQRVYSWLTKEQFEELLDGGEVEGPEGDEIDSSDFFYDLEIWPYDMYCDSKGDCLESSSYEYTTPGGEKVRALAFYGYDG